MDGEARYAILDRKTGDIIDCDIFLEARTLASWEKVQTEALAAFIECGGSASTSVIAYMVRNREPGNLLVDTYSTIASKTGASVSSVRRVMSAMNAKGLLRKLRNGVYIINGDVIRYGSRSAGAAIAAVWAGAGKHG